MFTNLICPVSKDRVDSNVSRLTVFFNTLLMVYFLVSMNVLPLVIVTLDYGIRAAGQNRYSPLCMLAQWTIKALGVSSKMVDKAPKVFASRLGFLCAFFGVLFFALNLTTLSFGIVAFFAVLATLDSVFNRCVGCMIYNYLVFPFYNRA